MTRKSLALLAIAVAIVGVTGLLHSAPVEATSHRAVRSFSAPWVPPGGTLEVTITSTGYGSFGQVVETLPAGFGHTGSDLSKAAVAVEGQTVTFTLLGEETLTYTVTAPTAEGSYIFSGIIKDVNRVEASVGGASSIRVGPPPTPTPTPTRQPRHPRLRQPRHPHLRQPRHPRLRQPRHPHLRQPRHPRLRQPRHPHLRQPRHPRLRLRLRLRLRPS